ncbi:hypothetical protein MRB53_037073 [Persea americana]|nr:hypothetical protein MRB53_037073 [Persea americana]
MSSDPESRDNYGPYLPGVGCVCPATNKPLRYNNIEDLKQVLEAHGKQTAAFFSGADTRRGRHRVPDDDYLREVKALCEKHNVLLICDEIQTGIARTGKMLLPRVERHQARPRAPRQGHLGRHVPRLMRARIERGHAHHRARHARLHVRRQSSRVGGRHSRA